MKRILLSVLVLSWILTSVMAFAQPDQGMIVFTKSALTRDGFREYIIKEIYSEEIWWTFFRRNICVINPDGTGFKQLTEDDTSYHPRWSPDGQKIAFCFGTTPRVSLHVMDRDGANRIPVVKSQNNIYDYRWSPDGTKIMVYVKTKSPRDPEETWIVTIGEKISVERIGRSKWARGWNHWASEGATLERPRERLLNALPKEIEWPEWSPDNRYLAFIKSGKLSITDTMVVGMLEQWRLGQFDPPCNKIMDWSPDGSKFLFLGGSYVSSVNVDGTGLANLSMAKATDACWSPDGSYIAYSSPDGHKENDEIFIMRSDGTGHTKLTNTNYFHLDLDWR